MLLTESHVRYTIREELARQHLLETQGSLDHMGYFERELLIREAMYPRATLLSLQGAQADGTLFESASTARTRVPGMLNENAELTRSGVQFLLSAAGEYGLGGVTLPAGGSGLAVGPTVETVVDAVFGAEAVASAANAVKALDTQFDKFGPLASDAMNLYKGNRSLDSFYTKLKALVRAGLKVAGEQATKTVDEMAADLSKLIEDSIDALVRPLKAGLKIVIPDAVVGTTIAEGAVAILTKLAERPFDAFKQLAGKSKAFTEFLLDPSEAIDFFSSVLDQIADLAVQVKGKVEDTGWLKAIATAGVSGAGIKAAGPKLLTMLSDGIKKYKPVVLKAIDLVLNVVVPAFLSLLGMWQILTTGEYKGADKTADKGGEEGASPVGEGRLVRRTRGERALTESDLRRFIRGTIDSSTFEPSS